MKMIEKIKKVLMGLGMFLLSIPAKVFASGISPDTKFTPSLYGIFKEPDPKALMLENILNICKIVILPITLIVGILVYLFKSKSSKKRKAVTVIIWIICAIVIYFIIENIRYNIEIY